MHYKLKDEVLAQEVADEMVILDPVSGEYFTLNSVGSTMLALLQQNKNIDEVANKIADEYTISCEVAKSDYLELIDTLKDQDLIEER